MKKKIICIMFCMMLVTTALFISFVDKSIVRGDVFDEDEDEGSIGEYNSYVYNITKDLSQVIYFYPKGRAFGTDGERYVASYIKDEMDIIGLSDPHEEKIDGSLIKSIWEEQGVPGASNLELIDDNFEVHSYNFVIKETGELDDYPECYPRPTSVRFPNPIIPKINGNFSYNDLNVFPAQLYNVSFFENYSYSIPYTEVSTNGGKIIGEVLNATENTTLPDNVEGYILLLNEDDPDYQDKINDSLNASGFIMIRNESRAQSGINATISGVFVSSSDGQIIKNQTKNGTTIAYNFFDEDNLTLVYHINETLTERFGEILDGFLLYARAPTPEEFNTLIQWKLFNTGGYWGWLERLAIDYVIARALPKCYGLIIDHYKDESYFMMCARRCWNNYNPFKLNIMPPSNCLPSLFVNRETGDKLNADAWKLRINKQLSIDYHIDQTFERDITSYNVIGNSTRSENSDKVAIIGGHYDGYWGQCAGDNAIGPAIVLGLAKYIEDYELTPKYKLRFMAFAGEDLGFRGSIFHNLSTPDDDIELMINLDMLGYNQEDPPVTFVWSTNQEENFDIIENITLQTLYTERTGYSAEEFSPSENNTTPSDNIPFEGRSGITTISFGKDHNFTNYHSSGTDHTEGDSMQNMDRNDMNVTFELAWNTTKYYLFDPDCWFTNVSYEAIDSQGDGDSLPDSIRANFTINSILPHDLTRVEVIRTIHFEGGAGQSTIDNLDYVVKSNSLDVSYTYTIPDTADYGNYSLFFRLYNSTGRINDIVGIGTSNHNDTSSSSDTFTLYHPLGCPQIFTKSQQLGDRISGVVFKANEDGRAINITAHLQTTGPRSIKCMLYRKSDSVLIGETEEFYGIIMPHDWHVFEFEKPYPVLMKDTEYVIVAWASSATYLRYDDFEDERGRYDNEDYPPGDPPDPAFFTNESRLYSIYCSYINDTTSPEINNVIDNPDPVGFGFNVTINVDVFDNDSGVDEVKVSIGYPGPASKNGNFTMSHIGGDTYEYVFDDTWLVGQYNYTIWVLDNAYNSNESSGHSFNVSANATISVCTIKDTYGTSEDINITDPPVNPTNSDVGYELLDDGDVLRIWNKYDSYYFNTSSGIQLTNHYDEYWSHNVLMLGYYNNDQWNLIYRTDELIGFNKDIDTDNETYVNATIWKNLNYNGYDFRLAIRYHLEKNDADLTIIPYIKNLGSAIPYILGFGWEMKDIQIKGTPENDYIKVNRTSYYLNQTLDEKYTNLSFPILNSTGSTIGWSKPVFNIVENETTGSTKYLYLKWDKDLDYLLQVKDRTGQYNAPVTLFIKVGTLGVGQEKYTELQWYDSESTYYFDFWDEGNEEWETAPELMVNGEEGESASTTQVEPDIQLLTTSTYTSGGSGTITAVEIRAHGYIEGAESGNIILTPVFNGEADGDDHIFGVTGEADWSEWFDITTDTNAPFPWRWTDVANLDCDVKSDIGEEQQLYCGKVELKVTYTSVNNTAPEISNPYPPDGSTGISISPTLNITVSDPDKDVMNITWYSNSSGSWQIFGTNIRVTNGTYHQTFANATENGKWWYWNVSVNDGTDTVDSSVYKFYTGYQSKIENTGSRSIKGYLLIQVQYYNTSNTTWVVVDDTINETTPRTLHGGSGESQDPRVLALDTIFNGLVDTSDLTNGDGTYRVYAAFRDPDGDVLMCDDESLLEAWYEFEVDTS